MNIEDQQLFDKILAANKYRLLRICRVYCKNPSDVLDLYQEVLLNVWKGLKGFREESNINTWFYRIALNVALRFQDKSKKRLKVTDNFIEIIQPENIVKDLIKQEQIQQLHSCIQQLKEIDRQIILLHLEELSYAEIGAVIGISESNVGARISRAKQQLIKLFNKK